MQVFELDTAIDPRSIRADESDELTFPLARKLRAKTRVFKYIHFKRELSWRADFANPRTEMTEALGFALRMLVAGGVIFCAAYVIRSYFAKSTIPQSEIDAEARKMIVDHGAGAEREAYLNWQRSQWEKGNNTKIERAERLLKTVRERARYLG